MSIKEELSNLEEKERKVQDNPVINFCYEQRALTENEVDGTEIFDFTKANNIPLAEAELVKVDSLVLAKGFRSQASSVSRMLLNHFFGRVSYNLNKTVELFKNTLCTLKENLGKPKGLATLDDNGQLPMNQATPVPFLLPFDNTVVKVEDAQKSISKCITAKGVAAAYTGNTPSNLVYSYDGIQWFYANISTSVTTSLVYTDIIYANGLFLAVAAPVGPSSKTLYTAVSMNGIDWTLSEQVLETTNTFTPSKLIAGENKFLCLAYHSSLYHILYSEDGVNWQLVHEDYYLYQVIFKEKFGIYANNQFILADSNGIIVRLTDATSVEIIQLRSLFPTLGSYTGKMLYAADKFVLLFEFGICYSIDGQTWNAVILLDDTRSKFTSILYTHNKFILVGYLYNFETTSTLDAVIYTSSNGIQWNKKYTKPSAISTTTVPVEDLFSLRSINNTIFWRNLYSSDFGETWNELASGFNYELFSCSYNKGLFISSSTSTLAYLSTNGFDWFTVNNFAASNTKGIFFINNTCVLLASAYISNSLNFKGVENVEILNTLQISNKDFIFFVPSRKEIDTKMYCGYTQDGNDLTGEFIYVDYSVEGE